MRRRLGFQFLFEEAEFRLGLALGGRGLGHLAALTVPQGEGKAEPAPGGLEVHVLNVKSFHRHIRHPGLALRSQTALRLADLGFLGQQEGMSSQRSPPANA